MAYRIPSQLYAFEVAGVDLTDDVKDIKWKQDNEDLDTSVLSQAAKRHAAGQCTLGLSFSCHTQATTGCSDKVLSSSLTVLTVGGTNYLTTFKSMSFTLDVDHDDVSAGADVFKSFQGVAFDMTGEVEVMVPTGATHAWWTLMLTSSSSMQATLSFTLAGTVITAPMTILSGEYVSQKSGVTTYKLTLKGFPACSGSFPTAPSSGTNLLTGFLVDPLTAVNVEYASASSNAEVIDVNMVLKSLSFSVERGQVVMTNYEFVGTGTPALSIS